MWQGNSFLIFYIHKNDKYYKGILDKEKASLYFTNSESKEPFLIYMPLLFGIIKNKIDNCPTIL